MSKARITGIVIAVVSVVAVGGISTASLFPFTKAESAAWSESTAPAERTTVDDSQGETERHPVRYVEDGELSAPTAIHKVNPKYPEEARKEKIQGEVVCEAIIDAKGNVVDAKILESAHESLEQPTIDALEQWIFEPARDADGEAVDVLYEITVNFRLQ